ncbi:class II fructose-bisphosphate aldolase [Candidatus Parcubacteria bacterium]|nr:MAG: class II fructose-bisphosphate aldolase [Candidatus Parcubacteria bacterium]
MESLSDILKRARTEGWAVGHFNASNLEQMRVICRVCRDLKSPAMIGTSEGERDHMGLAEAVALRSALRHEFGIPVFLNADHSKSVETAKAAVDAGYDSVHIDLSAKPFAENLAGTKEVVIYARAKNAGVVVEGELGYLRGESKLQKEKIEIKPEDLTDPDQAEHFVAETGVDRLAPAVGNSHGIALDEPALDIERIRAVRARVPESVALVLHGGSGIPEDQIKAAIAAGIANIHVNTELRVAFVRGLRQDLSEHPDETTPYKLYREAEQTMAKVIEEKLKLFGAMDRI